MADGAVRYGWTMPVVSAESNIIHIEGGRHPLLELVSSQYIPNDCILGGNAEDWRRPPCERSLLEGMVAPASIMLITGPNHSGKSVYLKQVALIVYLAHIGSFVPAKTALIGLTDKILTRISTRECAWRDDSAFSIDLQQMSLSLQAASRRSLVLIDEFGKGTQPDDGVGLLAAILRNFLTRDEEAPRVLAATHSFELVGSDYWNADYRIYLARMEVNFDAETDALSQQPVYLYTLRSGGATSSFGTSCATINGVDELVVQRAKAIATLLRRDVSVMAICSRLQDVQRRELQSAENISRKLMSMDLRRRDEDECVTARDAVRTWLCK